MSRPLRFPRISGPSQGLAIGSGIANGLNSAVQNYARMKMQQQQMAQMGAYHQQMAQANMMWRQAQMESAQRMAKASEPANTSDVLKVYGAIKKVNAGNDPEAALGIASSAGLNPQGVKMLGHLISSDAKQSVAETNAGARTDAATISAASRNQAAKADPAVAFHYKAMATLERQMDQPNMVGVTPSEQTRSALQARIKGHQDAIAEIEAKKAQAGTATPSAQPQPGSAAQPFQNGAGPIAPPSSQQIIPWENRSSAQIGAQVMGSDQKVYTVGGKDPNGKLLLSPTLTPTAVPVSPPPSQPAGE